jgi:hypothetical protein
MEDTGGCVGDFDLITVNALRTFVDNNMSWPSGLAPRSWLSLSRFPETSSWFDRVRYRYRVYRWIVFVMRGKNPEDNPLKEPSGN